MKKLYISDLDGTLLDDKANLSQFGKDKLHELITNHNLNFTVATARNVYSIMEMFRGVELKLPVIELNGAFITDITTGEKLVTNDINPQIIEGFLQLCKDYGQFPLISSFDGAKSKVYFKPQISEGMDLCINDNRETNVRTLVSAELNDEYLKEKILCFTLINKKEYLDDLVKDLEKKYGGYLSIYYSKDIYYPDWHWASIYSTKSKKGNAIKSMIDYMNMQDYEITVFGDHNNDVDMFRVADVSVAVANAQEDLKKRAHKIIGTNMQNSVVKYIRDDIKKYVPR